MRACHYRQYGHAARGNDITFEAPMASTQPQAIGIVGPNTPDIPREQPPDYHDIATLRSGDLPGFAHERSKDFGITTVPLDMLGKESAYVTVFTSCEYRLI